MLSRVLSQNIALSQNGDGAVSYRISPYNCGIVYTVYYNLYYTLLLYLAQY